MLSLHNHIIEAVLLHLEVADILNCSAVCRRLNSIISSNTSLQLAIHRRYLQPRTSHFQRNNQYNALKSHLESPRKNFTDLEVLTRMIERERNLVNLSPKHHTFKLPEDQLVVHISNDYIISKFSASRWTILNPPPPNRLSNGCFHLLTIWDIPEHPSSEKGDPTGKRVLVPVEPDINTLVVSVEQNLVAFLEQRPSYSSDSRQNTLHLFYLFNQDEIASPRGVEKMEIEFVDRWLSTYVNLQLGCEKLLRVTRDHQDILVDWEEGTIACILTVPKANATRMIDIYAHSIEKPRTKVFLDSQTIACDMSWYKFVQTMKRDDPRRAITPIGTILAQDRCICIYDMEELPKITVSNPNGNSTISQPFVMLSLPLTPSDLPQEISERLRPSIHEQRQGLIGATLLSNTSSLGYLHLTTDITIENPAEEGAFQRASICTMIRLKTVRDLILQKQEEPESLQDLRHLQISSESSSWKADPIKDTHAESGLRGTFPTAFILECKDWVLHSTMFIQPGPDITSSIECYEDKVVGVCRTASYDNEIGNKENDVNIVLQDFKPTGTNVALGESLGGLGKTELVKFQQKQTGSDHHVPSILTELQRRTAPRLSPHEHGNNNSRVTISEAYCRSAPGDIEDMFYDGQRIVIQYTQGGIVDILDF